MIRRSPREQYPICIQCLCLLFQLFASVVLAWFFLVHFLVVANFLSKFIQPLYKIKNQNKFIHHVLRNTYYILRTGHWGREGL